MVAIMSEYLEQDLSDQSVLSVGGSTGIIDEYLARYFQSVCGIDIDEKAIAFAKENFQNDNLSFEIGDALQLKYENESFDVVKPWKLHRCKNSVAVLLQASPY